MDRSFPIFTTYKFQQSEGLGAEDSVFSKILVPLDGSALAECVLPHAITIAHAFNAQVYLLQVLEQPSTVEAMALVDPLTWRLKKTEADLYLGNIKTRLEQSNVLVDKDLLE